MSRIRIEPDAYMASISKTALTMVQRYGTYKPMATEINPLRGDQEEYLNQMHDVITEFLKNTGIKIG